MGAFSQLVSVSIAFDHEDLNPKHGSDRTEGTAETGLAAWPVRLLQRLRLVLPGILVSLHSVREQCREDQRRAWVLLPVLHLAAAVHPGVPVLRSSTYPQASEEQVSTHGIALQRLLHCLVLWTMRSVPGGKGV